MVEKSKKGHSVTLTAHGDGTYHTQEHGQESDYGMSGGRESGRTEHPSFGHAIMHIAKHHGPEGDHMHIHGEEDGYTTHHVMDDGEVEGPHEHANMRELKKHTADTMESD